MHPAPHQVPRQKPHRTASRTRCCALGERLFEALLVPEAEPHDDGVPQLAARVAVVLDAPPLLDEPELPVERERRLVVRPYLEAELVQALLARTLDRRTEERRPDAAAAPLARDVHAELAEAEAA